MFFVPTSRGIEVDLPHPVADLLRQLLDSLAEVGSQGDDPAAGRLSVPAYLGDPGAQADWAARHADRLELGRMADRATVLRIVSGETGHIDREEAAAVLRVLVEMRLMAAARLGIEVASDYERLGEGESGFLSLLAWLQESVIEALDHVDQD